LAIGECGGLLLAVDPDQPSPNVDYPLNLDFAAPDWLLDDADNLSSLDLGISLSASFGLGQL
jgi:hypothetical protein